jgi:phage shock protein E
MAFLAIWEDNILFYGHILSRDMMSKKTQSKAKSKARSKRSKSNNIVIRKPYLYAGAAVLAVIVVIVLVVVSNGSGNKATAVAGLPDATHKPQIISPAQYEDVLVAGNVDHVLIDVRTPEEFAGEHIDGAININVEEIHQRLSEIPTDKPIVVYCRSGNRSAQAAQVLDTNGFANIYDLGGITAWKNAGFPVVQ